MPPGSALDLDLLPTPLAILRLPDTAPLPAWTGSARAFLSVTRTPGELSIVADAVAVPSDLRTGSSYVALRVRGPLSLDLVGVLAAIAAPLAEAGIPILPIATFDTDYVLVREADAGRAVEALAGAGHRVAR